MSSAPPRIIELVETFERNIETYHSQQYNETQLRREFIDPFFEELGWDIQNKAGIAQAYKDVIHEDAIKIGGTTKAPDYCFRIGPAKKFFVEAKKPAVNIKSETSPAYQLRRYAWSAKLPLSILTNFEEFAVYDCQIRPGPDDKPSTGRIMFFTYKDYADKWEQIANIFGKEAVHKGLFDKYASEKTTKRGTTTVDKEFLAEIEGWRNVLAKNIAIRNGKLSVYDLNFAVQKTIDRILFLRICEDRGIERSEQLSGLINGSRIYPRLFELFEKADEKYNSGIFHFRREKDRPEGPDELSANLKIDDDVLTQIFKDLYYPRSPYEFSVMPAEILGQVYEQFLGKVIRLTKSHQAKVEEKPEVKKAGGVYYTPSYIVDYIVKNTVGRLLNDCSVIPSAPVVSTVEPAEESIPNCHSRESGNPPRHCESAKGGRGNLKPLTPKQIEKLKILDPACGSGSFLIGAYRYLLDYHRDYYEKEPSKYKKLIYKGKGGQWFLTINEKKRILLNNIYGVDIDSQAAEVTKLSLLLKVLENETQESLRLFHERALPDLGNNIKCGNSLIGPDFYQKQQLTLFGDEQQRKINAFDWNAEFPQVFKQSRDRKGAVTSPADGFDAVIGNPPYIFTREQLTQVERDYFSEHFKLSWEKHNTFMLFMESLLRLVKETGRGSYIVPNSWLTIESGHLLREKYIRRLELVADLNYAVFHRVSMEPCIFVVSGKDTKSDVEVVRARSKDEFLSATPTRLRRAAWDKTGNRITLAASTGIIQVLDKVRRNSCPIEERFDVKTGLQAYERGKGNPPQTERDVSEHVFDRTKREDKNSVRYLEGHDVGRYSLLWSGIWMQYGPWLSQPRGIEMFTRPRVLLREITAPLPYCLYATFSAEPYLNNKSILNVLHPDDSTDELKALTCVLNSRLLSVFYKNHAVKGARTLFPKVVIKNLREFPFPRILNQKAIESLVAFADAELELHKKLAGIKNPDEKTRIQRQIDAADSQIDKLVYELYGLTPDEIAIVEGGDK